MAKKDFERSPGVGTIEGSGNPLTRVNFARQVNIKKPTYSGRLFRTVRPTCGAYRLSAGALGQSDGQLATCGGFFRTSLYPLAVEATCGGEGLTCGPFDFNATSGGKYTPTNDV